MRRTGPETVLGAAATTQWRLDTATLGNADASFGVTMDGLMIDVALTAARGYTVLESGAVDGMEVHISNKGSGAFTASIKRQDGTLIVILPASLWCAATLCRHGGLWRLKDCTPGAVPQVGA